MENISRAIGHSMEAEFTKLRNLKDKQCLKTKLQFIDWLEQTYLTSGSLLANSCQSALLLVGHKESYQAAAYEFGKNLAITRQVKYHIATDILKLDFDESDYSAGKISYCYRLFEIRF